MDRANKAAILMIALGIGIFVGNAKASMWNNPHGGATAQNVRYAAIVEAPKSLDLARAYSFPTKLELLRKFTNLPYSIIISSGRIN
ncbi:hypothetical protein [Candidatus Coxiella mudrowiae]|uniref:hypothetical protein n=1 Tax=Candidatus Coxiella mudrowiae TaxID=2054173 RepID=UPI001F1C868E|nr:hypothetical protein [Candidatus Coxiella mudrowiae]